MCGRFVLSTPADALAAEFQADLGGLLLKARYNIAPMTDIVVVRTIAGRRTLCTLRWGLVPFWAKDPAIANKLINARAETAATKPSFHEALRKRRCVVPATGFYEWKKEGSRKQPWYFRPRDPAASLAIAAVWEKWKSPEGETLETCCLLTTSANGVLSPVHDRMPVLLDRDAVTRWLDPENSDPSTLADVLVPCAEERIAGHPVSLAVNSVRNDDARCIEEEAAGGQRDLPL